MRELGCHATSAAWTLASISPFAPTLTPRLHVFLGQLAGTAGGSSRRRLEPVYGPIELSSSCSDYNCFDGAHISGYDITCEVGVSEVECAEKKKEWAVRCQIRAEEVAAISEAIKVLYFLRVVQLIWV